MTNSEEQSLASLIISIMFLDLNLKDYSSYFNNYCMLQYV